MFLPQNSGLSRLASEVMSGSQSIGQLHGSAAAVGSLVRSGTEIDLMGKQKSSVRSFSRSHHCVMSVILGSDSHHPVFEKTTWMLLHFMLIKMYQMSA